jgi:predicted transcriptional regulator
LPITVKVKDVMDKNVVTIDSSKAVSDALEKMIQAGVWSLIVERQGLPVGVVTDRDILRRCAAMGHFPDKVKVEDIMSSPIITISPDATAGEAMRTLIDKAVRRIYVVEGGKITGRVTQTALFQNMLDVMMTLASLPYQL